MSKSKNDTDCMGGTKRFYVRPARDQKGQQDAIYQLIDPKTGAPYTNATIVAALKERAAEQPALAEMIAADIAAIERKAKENPDAKYEMRCRGKTAQEATRRAKKELLPRIERMAALLFAHYWKANIEYGNVTIEQYVHYAGDALFSGETADARNHMMSALRTFVLPVIGEMRLRDMDSTTQTQLVCKVNRLLSRKKASASSRGYAKRAYKGLFAAIESSGYGDCATGIQLADMIAKIKGKNSALVNSVRSAHLDDDQRAALFAVENVERREYLMFVLAMIYCGMETCEISAQRFGDIVQLNLDGGESCYIITITSVMRRLNKRYSQIGPTNKEFPLRRLRKVVLYPWAATILLEYIDYLRNQGYSDHQIAQMRLSDPAPDGAIVGPADLDEMIGDLLMKAGISESPIPRTRKNGAVYLQAEVAGVKLLYRDAQYLAQICGADLPMLHAMFGLVRSETDEEAYLDILSDEYAVARYLRLRRCPSFENIVGKVNRHIFAVKNDTGGPQTVKIISDYAVKAEWREIRDDKNN